MLRIGLVMLQGARHAHLHALNEAAKDLQIEVEIFELRNKNDLLQCNPQAIELRCGEIPLFMGSMGQKGGNMAIKVNKKLRNM